jgi:hypothetical protein
MQYCPQVEFLQSSKQVVGGLPASTPPSGDVGGVEPPRKRKLSIRYVPVVCEGTFKVIVNCRSL